MNLPNKLTLLRILLVPFFVALLLLTAIPHSFLLAGVVFAAASVTDYFDGHIARKHNLITDFGKFADPLADKILVISAFVCFVQLGIIGAVPVIIVLLREFAVTSVRLMAASKGSVVAANMWGKAKTVSQIIAISAVLLFHYILQLVTMGLLPFAAYIKQITMAVTVLDNIFVWISVLFAVISGVIYLFDNREFFANAA
ncbi:CDP-diacylglycerol--glycerol-3-phosphate 3-phosphatidyltransferase [Clostridia bacterium]|nr:CDP-diacylglycerol--glycerol-3-phosphate 3-phosphatidyltransferase [Clostridia bacterium]